jgi:hypothetical protein
VDLANLPANGDARTFRFVAPANTDNAGHFFAFFTQNGNADLYVFDDAGNLLGGNSNGGTGNEAINLNSQIVAGQTYHVTVIPELYAAPVAAAQIEINLNTVPLTPGAPDLLGGDDTGASDADNVTRTNTSLSLRVPAEEAVFVRLFRDGTLVAGPIESGAAGVQLDDPAPLADGTYAYTATTAGSPTGIQSTPTAALSVTVDNAGPRVAAALASGTAWTAGFLNLLQTSGLGVGGFAVPAGAGQLAALPFANANRLVLDFSEDVSVQQGDLAVRGVAVPNYAASGFAYDPIGRRATWTLGSAVGRDKLRLVLDATTANRVTDLAGNVLDGDWTDASAAESFPSGDGAAGGDFRFRVNVLPGDANGSGTVDVTDLGALATNFNQNNRGPRQGNFNGDAAVNVADLGTLATNFNRGLPAGDPASIAARGTLRRHTVPPARVAPRTAALVFGATPIRRARDAVEGLA